MATLFLRSPERHAARAIIAVIFWRAGPRCDLATPTMYENSTTSCRLVCSAGAPSDASGAESLTDREWESLLLYSYNLRRVAVGATNLVSGQPTDDECASEDLEEHFSGCSAGVGLRGARGLRGSHRNGKCARRPASAPVERSSDKVMSQRRQRLSRSPTITSDAALSAARVRAHHSKVPANLGAAEARDLRKGLVS